MAKTKTSRGRKPAALKMIGVNDFKNLVKQCNNLKKKAGAAASEMGGLISNAAENKYLDKTAFSIFRRLERMEPQKLGTTLACFDYYRDIGGLDQIVEDNPPLDIERQEISSERTLTLVPKRNMPSKAEIKAAADRAEMRAAE